LEINTQYLLNFTKMSKTARLGIEREDIIDKFKINFSKFVKEQFDIVYKSPSKIKEEIEELKKQIKEREDLIVAIELERDITEVDEKEYLVESKKILNIYGEFSKYFENRFKGFVKQFNKKYITLEVFKELSLNS